MLDLAEALDNLADAYQSDNSDRIAEAWGAEGDAQGELRNAAAFLAEEANRCGL